SCDTVFDPEVERLQMSVGIEQDVDSIEPKSCFVDDTRSESVCFIKRKDLTPRSARVAKTRNGIALESRFTTLVTLDRIVTVKAIVSAERMTNVSCPLIDIYRRSC